MPASRQRASTLLIPQAETTYSLALDLRKLLVSRRRRLIQPKRRTRPPRLISLQTPLKLSRPIQRLSAIHSPIADGSPTPSVHPEGKQPAKHNHRSDYRDDPGHGHIVELMRIGFERRASYKVRVRSSGVCTVHAMVMVVMVGVVPVVAEACMISMVIEVRAIGLMGVGFKLRVLKAQK